MEVQLPRTSYGPTDRVACTVTLTGNPDWESRVKKVRAEKLSLSLEQIVTYRLQDSAPQTRTKKIAEFKFDFGGMKLIEKPLVQTLGVPFPSNEVRDKSGLVSSNDSVSASTGLFTTKCKLFSVEFQLTIKATFKGAKDIICTTPIIASQYNLANSKVILENIESAVYEFADVKLVSGLCGEPTIVRKSDVGFSGPGQKRATLIME